MNDSSSAAGYNIMINLRVFSGRVTEAIILVGQTVN